MVVTTENAHTIFAFTGELNEFATTFEPTDKALAESKSILDS
jgi:hypothetical protein